MAHPGPAKAHGTKSECTQLAQMLHHGGTSRSLWQCSTCTYAKNKWAAVECEVCGSIIRAKRPGLPIPASNAVTSKPCKKEKPHPQDPPPPTHTSGVVVDVVRTNRGDCGCSCEEHSDGCSVAVLPDDVVIHIRKEQILVKDYLLGKGRMRDRQFVNLHTTINCKSVWTMEGESGRMRSCRGDAVSSVRLLN